MLLLILLQVVIIGLYTSEHDITHQFDRPVRAIALDPNYNKPGSNRRFLTGNDKVWCIPSRRFSNLKALCALKWLWVVYLKILFFGSLCWISCCCCILRLLCQMLNWFIYTWTWIFRVCQYFPRSLQINIISSLPTHIALFFISVWTLWREKK